MPRSAAQFSYICKRCLQAYNWRNVSSTATIPQRRAFATSSPLTTSQAIAHEEDGVERSTTGAQKRIQNVASDTSQEDKVESGAMSRRLAAATEDALFEGGRAGKKAIEEAGFSEELKQKLLEKVKSQNFRAENASAFAGIGLPSSAGRGTRDIAVGQAWTGTESTEDVVLRMLDDAHKPLKPELRGLSRDNGPVVDLRLKREPKQSSGQRLANARDRTSIYTVSKDSQMSKEEREMMRKELKDRFAPAARAMPTSFRGLEGLANERIEDAIARGQFKVEYFPFGRFTT